MTKLLEWISVISAVFAVWYSLVGGYVKHPLLENNMNLILISPVIFVILFGLYAASVVLYRVFTFNNCEEASKELQEEIVEAKKDLREKGLQWFALTTMANLTTSLKLKFIKPFGLESVPKKFTYIHWKDTTLLAQTGKYVGN